MKPSIKHGITYRSTERNQMSAASSDQPQTDAAIPAPVDLNLTPEPITR